MKILSKNERCLVTEENGLIIKKFMCPLMFLKEKFVYEHFPWIAPELISIKDMEIVTKKGVCLRDWLKISNIDINIII